MALFWIQNECTDSGICNHVKGLNLIIKSLLPGIRTQNLVL